MRAPTLVQPRRWVVVALAWLLGAGAALALHRREAAPPLPRPPEDLRDELERTRREQTLLRAESTVRLLRVLEAHPGHEGAGP